MAILKISGLAKTFGGVSAISDLDFDVQPNHVFAVIGPNGAGKTTLFNMLTGLYHPTEGSILLEQTQLVGLPAHKIAAQGVSRTFQNLQIFLNMTVLDNVMVGCHLRGATGLFRAALRSSRVRREEGQSREWAMEALGLCEMDSLSGREAGTLPYGLLKRLEIARALASRPRLLLLDEPAAGLNDTETDEMARLVERIRDRGITTLLVEHNMALIMKVSDEVMVLNYGTRLAQGTPQEIQKNPEVIAAYLGE